MEFLSGQQIFEAKVLLFFFSLIFRIKVQQVPMSPDPKGQESGAETTLTERKDCTFSCQSEIAGEKVCIAKFNYHPVTGNGTFSARPWFSGSGLRAAV